jgi:hypothetical protein
LQKQWQWQQWQWQQWQWQRQLLPAYCLAWQSQPIRAGITKRCIDKRLPALVDLFCCHRLHQAAHYLPAQVCAAAPSTKLVLPPGTNNCLPAAAATAAAADTGFIRPRTTCQLKCEQAAPTNKLASPPYAIHNYDITTKTRRHSIERDIVSVTASKGDHIYDIDFCLHAEFDTAAAVGHPAINMTHAC